MTALVTAVALTAGGRRPPAGALAVSICPTPLVKERSSLDDPFRGHRGRIEASRGDGSSSTVRDTERII
jgi:hypothetical protein